jgi:hypothetical protein
MLGNFAVSALAAVPCWRQHILPVTRPMFCTKWNILLDMKLVQHMDLLDAGAGFSQGV